MIGIHHRPGSFSDRWIEYCDACSVPYKLVNCYDSDIIDQLKDCDGLMWHWAHHDHKAVLFARQLTYALEQAGKKVFPSSKTAWHFDDKVGQKYLLESIGAPLAKSWVFYEETRALEWARTAEYPVVFKLRGGAGSENVKLVRSENQAKRLIRRAFHGGFKQKNRAYFLKERLWHVRRDRSVSSVLNLTKGIGRLFVPTKAEKHFPRDRGYVYFQEFLPDNQFDTRVKVIGNRAFCHRRFVRSNDFRASGSGLKDFSPERIPMDCVKVAFETARKMQAQSVAFDFFMKDGAPRILEVSYGFDPALKYPCGYFSNDSQWREGNHYPQDFMIEDFLRSLGHGGPNG